MNSKKEETNKFNIATIKRSSLASSLGQHGQAAIEDMRSIFKSSKKSAKPTTSRMSSVQPSKPGTQMEKTTSVRNLSPAQKKQAILDALNPINKIP